MKDEWAHRYIKAFGNNLKRLRQEKGISQNTLSHRSEISISHISRMERGKRSPSINILYFLSKGLQVQPKTLLTFEFKK